MKPPVSRYISSPSLGKTPITKEDKLPIEINVSILKFRFRILFNADEWNVLPKINIIIELIPNATKS